jgi:hypothetical protein
MTGGKLRGGKAGFGAVYPAENELVLTLGFDDT